MKTLSFNQFNKSLLQDIIQTEADFLKFEEALLQMEQELDDMDSDHLKRLEAVKLVQEFKFKFAKDFCHFTLVKARVGVVGQSWYNDRGKDAS